VTALADGHEWLDRGANVLLFGPPGVGKSHLVCALGHALIDRLVHHATILEMNVESYRRRTAQAAPKKGGRRN
jgi:DNA replication protein DnaC